MGKQKESGMGTGTFTITQKSNWLGMMGQSQDILTFRDTKGVRNHLIKPVILDMRKMRPREESGLCETYESVYDRNCTSNSNIIFQTWPHKTGECRYMSKKPCPRLIQALRHENMRQMTEVKN